MERKRDELLDHDADGIREFDNDLPRWWLYGFYLTIVLSALYLVNYHVLPSSLVGASSIVEEYEEDVRAAQEARATRAPASAPAGLLFALTDPAQLEKGREIFEGQANVCSSCHRPDLGGLIGPDLADDTWIYGCTIGDVIATIRNGAPVRGMLPYGTGNALTDEQLLQVASYVLSKRGTEPPNPKPIDPEREKPCK
ncbi:MAG TPA: cbb3-type cytochrome c oxidase N-terminal domain-containing protein [Vicinamibacterales bacterium]|nr:cbb3-type cytochrome c oxidase N-terminal domain-containing protein [Vicinamibacterales bacterium]